MFHVISNSSIEHLDWEPEQHIIKPGTNYIILAGNITLTNKRAVLYAETLAKMYPDVHIIFNHGVLEAYQGLYDRIENGFELHVNEFKKTADNLNFPKGKCVGDYDFYCTVGWPTIIEEHNFHESFFVKSLHKSIDQELYINGQLMTNHYPRWYTLENVIEKSNLEKEKVAKWLSIDQGKPKVLISAMGDQSASYVGKSTYTTFEGIDLSGINWICGGDFDFIGPNRGAHVICLPGRDRTRYISEETMNLIL
jgi:hypothetical protein